MVEIFIIEKLKVLLDNRSKLEKIDNYINKMLQSDFSFCFSQLGDDSFTIALEAISMLFKDNNRALEELEYFIYEIGNMLEGKVIVDGEEFLLKIDDVEGFVKYLLKFNELR